MNPNAVQISTEPYVNTEWRPVTQVGGIRDGFLESTLLG